MKKQLTLISTLAISLILSACAYIGPPPEPAEIKSNQAKAVNFLQSLPALGKRAAAQCQFVGQGIKNLAGRISPYEQYTVSSKLIKGETSIALSLPSQRQYLSIVTSDVYNNECVVYRYTKQPEHAFYWGKDIKAQTAEKVMNSLLTLGVNKL
jgi:hypothetical protein